MTEQKKDIVKECMLIACAEMVRASVRYGFVAMTVNPRSLFGDHKYMSTIFDVYAMTMSGEVKNIIDVVHGMHEEIRTLINERMIRVDTRHNEHVRDSIKVAAQMMSELPSEVPHNIERDAMWFIAHMLNVITNIHYSVWERVEK